MEALHASPGTPCSLLCLAGEHVMPTLAGSGAPGGLLPLPFVGPSSVSMCWQWHLSGGGSCFLCNSGHKQFGTLKPVFALAEVGPPGALGLLYSVCRAPAGVSLDGGCCGRVWAAPDGASLRVLNLATDRTQPPPSSTEGVRVSPPGTGNVLAHAQGYPKAAISHLLWGLAGVAWTYLALLRCSLV